jgi:hypothetical protein
MADEDKTLNPLLAALPPATDYITYLTLIEYNLNEENLPVLHEVLQDTELTANICFLCFLHQKNVFKISLRGATLGRSS